MRFTQVRKDRVIIVYVPVETSNKQKKKTPERDTSREEGPR